MLVGQGKKSYPIFFCFLAYQLELYLFVKQEIFQRDFVEIGTLSSITIAFMVYVQITFGEWSNSKVAKIVAAILVLVAGGFAVVTVILTLMDDNKKHKTSDSSVFYYVVNLTVVAVFSLTSGILQFIFISA
ncbi:hypothetical protein HELRODRAFT_167112 [Helobdella robusta]|uniref:Uncharacterized protein n=1 Tax=Helobdella robusta TaxID=6412 RepID=T1EZ12_HELRO|nr:hypothetical protein HELRODRAFT_167112 [Helobdella robusta]ESO10606.1 hypothetical protein HELRODRAFT_167112 [Helobdella robusta]